MHDAFPPFPPTKKKKKRKEKKRKRVEEKSDPYNWKGIGAVCLSLVPAVGCITRKLAWIVFKTCPGVCDSHTNISRVISYLRGRAPSALFSSPGGPPAVFQL